MSAFIRQCWICHHIINILNNVIKLFAIPPPVCFDLVSGIRERRCEGADCVSLKANLFISVSCSVLQLQLHCICVFFFVFLYLCIFSMGRWCTITQTFHQLSSVGRSVWSGGTGWHLLPNHQTYKHSVRTVSTCQELTSSWHASYFPPSHRPGTPPHDCKSPPNQLWSACVDSSPCFLVRQSGLSVCARCGLPVVDRNPAEELKAAC